MFLGMASFPMYASRRDRVAARHGRPLRRGARFPRGEAASSGCRRREARVPRLCPSPDNHPKEIGVFVTLVGRLTRTRSTPRPLPNQAVLLADAGFVLEPYLDRRFLAADRRDGRSASLRSFFVSLDDPLVLRGMARPRADVGKTELLEGDFQIGKRRLQTIQKIGPRFRVRVPRRWQQRPDQRNAHAVPDHRNHQDVDRRLAEFPVGPIHRQNPGLAVHSQQIGDYPRRHGAVQFDMLEELIEPAANRVDRRHRRDMRRQPPKADRAMTHDQQRQPRKRFAPCRGERHMFGYRLG